MILVPRIAAQEIFKHFKEEFFEKIQDQILTKCKKSSANDFDNILAPWKTHYRKEFFEILLNQFGNKCAFCEVAVGFKKQAQDYEFLLYRNEQDYPWMKWQWPNWYLVCFDCNKAWKNTNKQKLILADDTQRISECIFDVPTLNVKEKPLILDPCTENVFELFKYKEVNRKYIKLLASEKHPLSKSAETTLDKLDLNRPSLQENRYKVFVQVEESWQLAVTNQSHAYIDGLLQCCSANTPFAGMSRYFLQAWTDVHEQETNGSEWQVVRENLKKWQTEQAVPPQPYPLSLAQNPDDESFREEDTDGYELIVPTAENDGANPAEEMVPSTPGKKLETKYLHTEIETSFNSNELIELCFYLDVDYNNLPGNTHRTKVIELIGYFERRGEILQLIAYCKKQRPKGNWDNPQK